MGKRSLLITLLSNYEINRIATDKLKTDHIQCKMLKSNGKIFEMLKRLCEHFYI